MNRMQTAGRSLLEPVRIRKLDKWKNDAEQRSKRSSETRRRRENVSANRKEVVPRIEYVVLQ